MKKSTIFIVVLASVLTVGAAGGGLWWWQSRQSDTAEAAPPKVKPSPYRYVTLDKIVVMLRNKAGDPLSHYMAVDLVFKAEQEQEKAVKEQLPLLRSVAVQALSTFTLDKAVNMTVDQLASELNAAYRASYAAEAIEQPFSEALIGKLIIE